MDQDAKRRAANKIFMAITAAMEELGASETSVNVVVCDTDLAPLQPVIGDHAIVSAAALIRLEDFERMQGGGANG